MARVGRPPIFKRAMTHAARQKRYRDKLKQAAAKIASVKRAAKKRGDQAMTDSRVSGAKWRRQKRAASQKRTREASKSFRRPASASAFRDLSSELKKLKKRTETALKYIGRADDHARNIIEKDIAPMAELLTLLVERLRAPRDIVVEEADVSVAPTVGAESPARAAAMRLIATNPRFKLAPSTGKAIIIGGAKRS